MAFEPVPHFYAFLEYNVHVNGLAALVDMRSNVISHESGKKMEVSCARAVWNVVSEVWEQGLGTAAPVDMRSNVILHESGKEMVVGCTWAVQSLVISGGCVAIWCHVS